MSDPEPLIIDPTKEKDILQIYPCSSLLSSSNLNWSGIHLGYYHLPPHSIPEKISPQHLILIHSQLPLEMNVEQRFDKRLQRIQIQDGDIIIIPANIPHRANWDREHSYISLSLDPQKLTHAAFSADLEPVELVPCFKKADPFILGIGLALKTEVESNGMGGNLYADSLTTALSLHLLRHYSTRVAIAENKYGLSKYKLRQVVEYINDQIDRNFTLAELAATVNISPSYFSYLFKLSTGYAPHQYVIRCRVERAKKLLLQENITIADISYSLGFAHQSHLNRHFKRLVGVTPKVFQQQK